MSIFGPEAESSALSAGLVGGLVAAITAGVVLLAGGGDAVWLAGPAALVAADRSRTRLATALTTGCVLAATTLAALIVNPARMPSLPLLVAVVGAGVAVLVSVRERLVREREALRDFALTDPLTGIANRRSLMARAEYEIARHLRTEHSFALVMVDLDGFKGLNDRFGHAAGDDLLRDVAGALARAMRAQDTVARLGGDEFCVLAPETDAAGTARLALRVRQAVAHVSAGVDSVRASVGVAIFPADGSGITDLMHAADGRLLDVKREQYRVRRTTSAVPARH